MSTTLTFFGFVCASDSPPPTLPWADTSVSENAAFRSTSHTWVLSCSDDEPASNRKFNYWFLDIHCLWLGCNPDASQEQCLINFFLCCRNRDRVGRPGLRSQLFTLSSYQLVCLFGWFGWFLNVLVNYQVISRTGPKTERLTILHAATHEAELGDHDFCLSRSHYTDTDPTSREWAATAGIKPGTSSPGVVRFTAWATAPPPPPPP